MTDIRRISIREFRDLILCSSDHYSELEPALPFTDKSRDAPFAIYDDSFGNLLGQDPALEQILSDSRGRFFYGGGAYIPHISTCFITSGLMRDNDPWTVQSGNRKVEITKLEFYGANKVARDKVRSQDRHYMAAGAAVHPTSDNAIIFCTQGTLHEPAGLVSIEAKRPHKPRMILNNFHGQPFNSPAEIISNPVDNSVYFTDPAYGYGHGFRPKPKLPSGHVYRFHPITGDCRVVVNDLNRPAGLALSPDYRTLYVSETVDGFDGVYIYAYDVSYSDSHKGPSYTLPGIKHAMNSSNGSSGYTSASSSQSSAGLPRGQPLATPEASPPTLPAIRVGRTASRSRSSSHTRNLDIANNHKFLTSMGHGIRSPSKNQAPTSEPLHSGHVQPPTPLFTGFFRKCGTFLSSKRLVAYSPNAVPSGAITTDPIHGDLWLGTEEGVEVWDAGTGELIGKVLVEDWESRLIDDHRAKMRGVAKVVFTGESEALLLGGERVWRLRMGAVHAR